MRVPFFCAFLKNDFQSLNEELSAMSSYTCEQAKCIQNLGIQSSLKEHLLNIFLRTQHYYNCQYVICGLKQYNLVFGFFFLRALEEIWNKVSVKQIWMGFPSLHILIVEPLANELL